VLSEGNQLGLVHIPFAIASLKLEKSNGKGAEVEKPKDAIEIDEVNKIVNLGGGLDSRYTRKRLMRVKFAELARRAS
jgi:hypothetical protein